VYKVLKISMFYTNDNSKEIKFKITNKKYIERKKKWIKEK